MENKIDTEHADEYLDAAYEQWDNIFRPYRQFEHKCPIMLYDIQEQRIYAYPYKDYLEELTEKFQQSLKEQYEEALRSNKIVIFIRDNDKRKLVSYSFAHPGQKRQ